MLVPGDAVLSAWTTFSEARQWAGPGDAEWAELATDLGEESLDSLVVVAAPFRLLSDGSEPRSHTRVLPWQSTQCAHASDSLLRTSSVLPFQRSRRSLLWRERPGLRWED